MDLAVDPEGNVTVVGGFTGTVNLGDGDHTPRAPYARDVYLVSISRKGDVRWAKTFDATDVVVPAGIGADDQGNVYVAVRFSGSVDAGDGARDSDWTSTLLASYDAGGDLRWAVDFGAPGAADPRDLSVTAVGDLVVAGQYEGEPRVGGEVLAGPGGGFVTAFSEDGTPRWTCAIDGEDTLIEGIHLHDDGDVTIAADGSNEYEHRGTFGRYAPGCGAEWIRGPIWEPNDEPVVSVAGDAGGTFLAYTVIGDVVAGPDLLGGHGEIDAVLERTDPSGTILWGARVGGPDWDTSTAVAPTGSGGVVLGGNLDDEADAQGLPVVGFGGSDAFAVGFDAEGSPLWARAFGGDGHDHGWAVAVDGDAVLVGGDVAGEGDIGPEPFSTGGRIAYVHRFVP
jgi:hypothetical protein